MGKPAARVGDMHTCPMFDGPKPHVGGPVLPPGVPTVLIGGVPAATVATLCTCAGPPDSIAIGSAGVLINSQPAARLNDPTTHGGLIVAGCVTVLIGDIFVEALDAIARAVNPGNSAVNCGNIIDAVIDRLNGDDPAATAPAAQDGSFSDIEARHGTNFTWGSSFGEAMNAVRDGGDGTTAIVGIVYGSGTASHVVVMTNNDGHVGIVEGQDWGADNPQEVITSPQRANERYNRDGASNVGWGIVP